MIAGLYFATFAVSLTAMLTLLIKHKKSITIAILFAFLVTVNSFGRFLISVSDNLETAKLGNLMVYIGGCFCPLMVVRILEYISRVHVYKWVKILLTVYSSVILLLVLTIGYSSVYYESCFLVIENGYHYLGKVYGPAHVLFPVLMILYFIVITCQLVMAIRKRKQISMHVVVIIVALAAMVIISYVVEKVIHAHISYLSVAYLLAMLIFMHLIDRINMYDLPNNIANSIDAMKENAYVEFDRNYRLAGYNTKARELFPEIREKWNIDEKIPEDDSFLYNEIVKWVYDRKKNEQKTIQLGDRFYDLFVRIIPYQNRPCVGYMLEIVDRTAEKMYVKAMQSYSSDLEEEVRRKTASISHIRDTMVVGMASMVESRDDSTGDHIKRTYQAMKTFSMHLMEHREELGFTPEFLDMVTRAAPMHDLGKIAIDDAILKKQGRLTPEEFERMKDHPVEGAKIVREILTGAEDDRFVEIAVNVAHYHHERWDGSGYPDGLKGTEIPVEARLMALADAFDAMISKRCYKEAFSYDKAFSIIENSLGTQFDPVLGRYFLECRPALEERYRQWETEAESKKMLQLESMLHTS